MDGIALPATATANTKGGGGQGDLDMHGLLHHTQ